MKSNDSPDSRQSSGDSANRLVKILIAVGIGIPVLVELLTLFNLVNIQIFGGGDKEVHQKKERVSEVHRFSEGDTLFSEYAVPVFIDELRVKVSTQNWSFELELEKNDNSTSGIEESIRIDSLLLRSGQVLNIQKTYDWESDDGEKVISDEWILPSGDIPVTIFLTSEQPVTEDSTAFVQQEVKLDHIPVRYDIED